MGDGIWWPKIKYMINLTNKRISKTKFRFDLTQKEKDSEYVYIPKKHKEHFCLY